jgi:hypothetical protein
MSLMKTMGGSAAAVTLAAMTGLAGCAVETFDEELGTETAELTTAERNAKIVTKFNQNTGLLGMEIAGSERQFTNGAKRDYTGAGNNSSIYIGDAVNRAHIVMGFIRSKYLAKNAQAGILGYPTTDEFSTAFNTGRVNFFQKGRILWKAGASEAFETNGTIDGLYTKLGLEWGNLGFTTRDQFATQGNHVSRFEFGRIFMAGGVPRPVITAFNPNAKLVEMNHPRLTNVTLRQGAVGQVCVSADGVRFPPNTAVRIWTSSWAGVGNSSPSVITRSDGTFSVRQTGSSCTNVFQSVSGITTVVASTNDLSVQAVTGAFFTVATNNVTISQIP